MGTTAMKLNRKKKRKTICNKMRKIRMIRMLTIKIRVPTQKVLRKKPRRRMGRIKNQNRRLRRLQRKKAPPILPK